MSWRRSIAVGIVVLLGVSLRAPARGEEAVSPEPLWGKTLTTGLWGDRRDRAEAKGVKFDATLTQIGQGVVSGGKSDEWEYGGRANLTANLDSQKLGLWPGGFLTVELESNWSASVNGNSGALMPVNTNQLFPYPSGDNVGLPQLTFAQFVSPYAGAIIGKLDTTLGDANAFAHGKGDTQFLNTALNINPVLLAVPYSPLGGGIIVLPTKDPHAAIVNFLVVQGTGDARTAGFDNISSDNLVFTGEGRVRTHFFGLTGHQLVGALYSNRKYTSVDQRLGFVIENRALSKTSDTWAVYYNFDQFLYEIDESAGRGVGLFGRFGAGEGNPIPVQYFFSFGLGGNGVFASRPQDKFGLGFYYAEINNLTLQLPFTTRSFLDDEWGFEAFYNIAITPWLQLTPDIQLIEPSQNERIVSTRQREDIDFAVVIGTRLQLIF